MAKSTTTGPRAMRGGERELLFRDRENGGRLLAGKVGDYRGEDPLVLAVPNGGVPVGLEVARALGVPLHLIVVQRFGPLDGPDQGIGAVGEGGAVYLNREALRALDVSEEDAGSLAEQAARELARRVSAYRGEDPLVPVAGRVVLLVDDGVETGTTARAAADALRLRGARRVVLATPVIAASTASGLRDRFDAVVAVEEPAEFRAVGAWYERFPEITDTEAAALLNRGSAA